MSRLILSLEPTYLLFWIVITTVLLFSFSHILVKTITRKGDYEQMRQAKDPLSTLIAPDVLPHLEQMSLPYTGYHFLRDNLTQKLLGESEAPILFWLGKDLGNELLIQKSVDLTLTFIRLGLGKLEVLEENSQQIVFSLYHHNYLFSSVERLLKTLSLESGIITGAVSKWSARNTEAQLEILTEEKSPKKTAKIIVSFVP